MNTGVGTGLGLGLTPTAGPHTGSCAQVQEQAPSKATGQIFGNKMRAQSLEWLEDALLSPSQAQMQSSGLGQADLSGRPKPGKINTQTSQDSGILSGLGLGFTPSASEGLNASIGVTALTPTVSLLEQMFDT